MSATYERPTVASLLFGYLDQQVELVYSKGMNAPEDDLHQLARLTVVIQGLENLNHLALSEERASLLSLAVSALKNYRFCSATVDDWKEYGLKSPWSRTFHIEYEVDLDCVEVDQPDPESQTESTCAINDCIQMKRIQPKY